MKCLVISYGSIGKRHYSILKNFESVTEIHVVTEQSLDDIKTYRSITDALSENVYGYIVVASPTAKHLTDLNEIVKLSSHSKVLIEKPLFHKFEDNAKIDNGNFFVGYNLRFHPVIRELKKMILNSGEVYYANFSAGQYLPFWRPDRDYRLSYSAQKKGGGGVLLDLSHEIDLLHCLFGEIQNCSSLVSHRSDLEIETEDITLIQGVTKKKVIFSISLDYISKMPIRSFLIQTENETIFADIINSKIIRTDKKGVATEMIVPKEDRNFSHAEIHSSILSGNIENICSYEAGMRVNYWIDQIKEKSIIKEAMNE